MDKWADLPFWQSKKWQDIKAYLEEEEGEYYPTKKAVFRALYLTPLHTVKVVILGQDPYYQGSATGLAFEDTRHLDQVQPSLQNIFQEYSDDLKLPRPKTGNLEKWARQGVLLLNTHLTVKHGNPLSSQGLGWEALTTQVLQAVTEVNPQSVFILWGKIAQQAAYPILKGHYNPRIETAHPSPMSAHKGFFGSRPFTKANALLHNGKLGQVNWKLDKPIVL